MSAKTAGRDFAGGRARQRAAVLMGDPASNSSGSTEHDEQVALFEWAALASRHLPDLGMLFAIPNGGARHKAVAGKLRAEGVQSGVPDICLPVARGGFHGLFIELKRASGGAVSEEQRGWIQALRRQGYHAGVCHGFEAAQAALLRYLRA